VTEGRSLRANISIEQRNERRQWQCPKPAMLEPLAGPAETLPVKPVRSDETVLRLSTDELVRLAPRLRAYLTTPIPGRRW
jgi:hypothetical protein